MTFGSWHLLDSNSKTSGVTTTAPAKIARSHAGLRDIRLPSPLPAEQELAAQSRQVTCPRSRASGSRTGARTRASASQLAPSRHRGLHRGPRLGWAPAIETLRPRLTLRSLTALFA